MIDTAIKCFVFVLLSTSLSISVNGQMSMGKSETSSSRQFVREAVDVMGGEQTMRSLSSLKLTGYIINDHLQDSPAPEGPWLLDLGAFEETLDLEGKRL